MCTALFFEKCLLSMRIRKVTKELEKYQNGITKFLANKINGKNFYSKYVWYSARFCMQMYKSLCEIIET